jgi:hypothetical protein
MEILSVWALTTPLQLLTKVVEKIPLRVLMVTIVKNIPSTAFMLTGLLVGLLPETWKGYSPRFDSWEPWSELKDCAAVDTYAFVANFTIPTV